MSKANISHLLLAICYQVITKAIDRYHNSQIRDDVSVETSVLPVKQ